MTTCQFAPDLAPEGQDISYNEALFTLEREETKLTRKFDSRPFVPGIKEERERRCDEILNIQAMGLKKTSGTYPLSECSDRSFWWTGFYTGTSCDRAGI